MRVQRLVTDSTGRVVGILAKQYGTEVAVRARRGVVLATPRAARGGLGDR